MAVERKKFLWIGGDRYFRSIQENGEAQGGFPNQGNPYPPINAGSTIGDAYGSDGVHLYGATGIMAWNEHVGVYTDAIYDSADQFTPGKTGSKKATDVFWNNKDNWAVLDEGGMSGGDGITEGSQFDGDYYVRATRVPHRGDHVMFKHVVGTTGNGLQRGLVGDVDPFINSAVGGTSNSPAFGKPFNVPLSPCFFGGYADPTGFTGEGSIWLNADTSGSSAANRGGPLSSVDVDSSYFHQEYGVDSGKFKGYFDDIGGQVVSKETIKFWGGKMPDSTYNAGPSGPSFANVDWAGKGIQLNALDVTCHSPYRMRNASTGANGIDLFPDTITNAPYPYGSGRSISVRGGTTNTPFTVCTIGKADSIINLTTGCRGFRLLEGTVHNYNVSDMYMPFATDDERKLIAESCESPEAGGQDGRQGLLNFLYFEGEILNNLRCDPCWWMGTSDFGTDIGNPNIIWGPYYAYGPFHPISDTFGTVTCYPQERTSDTINASDITNGVAGATSDNFQNGAHQDKRWSCFGSFQLAGGTSSKRMSVTTINMKEFNPRWGVVTSEGNKTMLPKGVRGFNNKMYMGAGATITNLNIDAGYFAIGDLHHGGDTFDEPHEVGDIVIINGYSEAKSYLNGEHPTITGFNAFYVGQGGVNETGQNFQIRSKDAEFDFGPGVYLRSGPAATGVTGAGFAFAQAPSLASKYNP